MLPDIPAGRLPGSDLIHATPCPGQPADFGTTPNAVTSPLVASTIIEAVARRAAEGEPKHGQHDRQGDFLRPLL